MVLDIQKLKECFPLDEQADLFIYEEEYSLTLRLNTDITDVDVSSLILSADVDTVYVQWIALSEDYKCCGYGTKILHELLVQARDRKLQVRFETAFEITCKIVNKLCVELNASVDSRDVSDYEDAQDLTVKF